MLKFRVRIELEKRFIKPIEACEFNCRDLEAWVESFALVEPLLSTKLEKSGYCQTTIKMNLQSLFHILFTCSIICLIKNVFEKVFKTHPLECLAQVY